ELRPLEAGSVQLGLKRGQLRDVEAKLKFAEQGRLKEVAAAQSQVGAEKAFIATMQTVAKTYDAGISLSVVKKDYNTLRHTAGEFTTDTITTAAFQICEEAIARTNDWLKTEEERIGKTLKTAGVELREALKAVPDRHAKWEERIALKIDELRKQGLSGNVAQLSQLVAQRGHLTADITKLAGQQERLAETRSRRTTLLEQLSVVRATLSSRRRSQVSGINETFKATIRDYSVYLRYVPGGLNADFVNLLTEVMHGSFMQDKDIERLCASTSPQALAELVKAANKSAIAALDGVGPKWAGEVLKRLQPLEYLHRLEITRQPPAPAIKVLTRTTPQKEIPITQLSDGQKHTIFLTIALLAESNEPLIIDQPEDDLDNAFICASVVSTLRYIKERRQVIIVTHNANIAVLGDSELLFPMMRSGNLGKSFERGAIDRKKTKLAAQDILEGGAAAFLKRKAIYGID
ncbi:MAG: AAA family ATPase, partial [Spirochaetes bacterium]|nr:AAA family ATPase [Spirochaetota bacterium]